MCKFWIRINHCTNNYTKNEHISIKHEGGEVQSPQPPCVLRQCIGREQYIDPVRASFNIKNCCNLLPTDCNIVGGDTQNYESLQPTNMTGYFSYCIPYNGTLVAANATEFCILTERTHQQVSLFLIIYREDNGIPMTILHVIPADCDLAKNNSVS